MSELAILVPTLGRPHRILPFLDAVEASTREARVLFLCDVDDVEVLQRLERQICRRPMVIEIDTGGGSYAEKINRGVRLTNEPYIFTAANDLEPRPGWFEAARSALAGDVEVAGVNDLIKRNREHATHFLMTRAYAELPTIDGGQGPMCTEYTHWWVDDELIATAKHRRAYAYVPSAEVDHLHPISGRAPDDEVYRRGRAAARGDRRRFRRREVLWT